MKERAKCKKRAITDLNAPNGSRDIQFQKSGILARWTSPFCRFSASFSLKYDVTDPMLQDNKKCKCNISGVFCLICLKLCRLLQLDKGFSLHFKFRCHGNQN